jgi:hypothetical protein
MRVQDMAWPHGIFAYYTPDRAVVKLRVWENAAGISGARRSIPFHSFSSRSSGAR